MHICSHCNTVNKDSATTCINCGAPLTKPILALICPKCGKVSPLGTSQCPVCHEKLTKENQQIFRKPIALPQKKSWKLIFLIIVLFVVAILFIGLRYGVVTPTRYIPYNVMELTYQDRQRHELNKTYYVVKQNKNKYQSTFSIAYLGQDNIGKAKMNTLDNKKLKHQYQSNPHYQLEVQKNKTIISGPRYVSINGLRLNNLRSNQDSGYQEKMISGKFTCTVNGDAKAKYVKIAMIDIDPG